MTDQVEKLNELRVHCDSKKIPSCILPDSHIQANNQTSEDHEATLTARRDLNRDNRRLAVMVIALSKAASFFFRETLPASCVCCVITQQTHDMRYPICRPSCQLARCAWFTFKKEAIAYRIATIGYCSDTRFRVEASTKGSLVQHSALE